MAKPPPSKEYVAFTKLTDRLLLVPRDVVQQPINAQREASSKDPHKPAQSQRRSYRFRFGPTPQLRAYLGV